MYLFDTNVLSEILKKKPSETLMQRISRIGASLQFTSCLCVLELRYGSRRRPDPESFWGKIEDQLLSRVGILELTTDTCILAGDIAAKLSLKGIGISAEDLLIGATALGSDMTLVTANVRHFEKIPGLKVENWFH